jgi:cytochrome o ubiquinol oxidase operon protein cyoD
MMSAPKPRSRKQAYRHDLRGYQTGFVLAALLTIIPIALVASGTFSTIATLWVIGVLGLVQIVVHVRYFLHVDLSRQRREELYLMLFSAALVTLLFAGMLCMLFIQHTRMM